MSQLLRRYTGCWLASLAFLLADATEVHGGARVETIRDRGYLVCGVRTDVPGFAMRDPSGRYFGFEIDLCRAVSAAIFGDPDQVQFKPAESVAQFKVEGDIDLVARRLTWTLTREAGNSLLFSPIVFYDGAGFLVRSAEGLVRAEQLSDRKICFREGAETEQALLVYFNAPGRVLRALPFPDLKSARQAFFEGECAALAADLSLLAAERAQRPGERDKLSILGEMISKEPLALLLRQDDLSLFLIVRWTIFALIEAEELDVTAANIGLARDPGGAAQWLLGHDTGPALGLHPSWVANVIRSVGNYGEIFARHLGPASPLGLNRGLNQSWTSGGLLYAPPVR